MFLTPQIGSKRQGCRFYCRSRFQLRRDARNSSRLPALSPAIYFVVKTSCLLHARLMASIIVPLLFASCADEFGCRRRQIAAPIFPMTPADLQLRRQINKINHEMSPLDARFDQCAYPRPILKQIAHLDEQVNHVNAELVLREVSPEEMRHQIGFINRQLARVEMDISRLNLRVDMKTCDPCRSGR